jgi:MoxR-like ATPase
MLDRMTTGHELVPRRVVEAAQVLHARRVIHDIYVDERVKEYTLDIVHATRDPAAMRLPDLGPLIEYGASPRAAIFLVRAAKAHAFLNGRGYVTPDDVKSIGYDVLRHRIILTYEAEAEDVTADDLLRKVFETVQVP